MFFTEWQWRAVGHYQVLCKALGASEVTEIACYFGKYELHTSKKHQMAWRNKMLLGNKIASVQNVPLCLNQLFLVQNKPGGHHSKPGWQTPLVVPLRHERQYYTSYLWDTQGRRPECEWPAVFFPRDERTALLRDCPPRQFSFFFYFLFGRGGKKHWMLQCKIVG